MSRALAGWLCAAVLLAATAAIPVLVNEQTNVAEQAVNAAVARTSGSAAAALAPAWVGFVQVADAVARSEIRFLSAPERLAAVIDAIPLDTLLLGVRVQDLNGDVIAERVTGQFDFPTTTDLFADLGPRRLRVHPARAGHAGAKVLPFSQLTTDQIGRPIAIVVYADAAALAAVLDAVPTSRGSRGSRAIDAVAEVLLAADDGSVIAMPRAATPMPGQRLAYAPPAATLLDGETRTYVGRLRADQPNQTIAYARVANWPLLVVAASTDEWAWLSSGRLIPRLAAIVGAVLAAIIFFAVLIGDRWHRHHGLLVQARARAHLAERALESTNAAIVSWRPGIGGVFYSPNWKRMLGIANGEIGDRLEELIDRVHPGDKPAVLRNLHGLVTGETPGRQIMYRIITRDGEVKQILESSVVERSAAGDTPSIVLTQIDFGQISQGAGGNTDAFSTAPPLELPLAVSAEVKSDTKTRKPASPPGAAPVGGPPRRHRTA